MIMRLLLDVFVRLCYAP